MMQILFVPDKEHEKRNLSMIVALVRAHSP
jgi:hypothetical protein